MHVIHKLYEDYLAEMIQAIHFWLAYVHVPLRPTSL